MLLLINGKEITLNEDQVAALEAINKWYLSGRRFFTLSGPAGSGKTTLVKKAIEGFAKPIRISAPTHKACKVVARSTGLFSMTIQALCGLKPDTKIEDINQKKFVPTSEPKLKDYSLIVIDEASMLGKEILELILELAGQHNTRILFMGDIYQLPPVKEKVSSVFTHPDIEVFHLTKVERQKGSNPLMKIYDGIRSDIHFEEDLFRHKTDLNDQREGVVFYKNGQDFFDTVMAAFGSGHYLENPNYAKILAWRNDTVKAWNGYVRQQIFGNDIDHIVESEVMMSYTHVYDDATRQTLITNSAEYKVKSVKKDFVWFSGVELKIYHLVLIDIDDPHEKEVERDILIPDYDNYSNFIRIWHTLLSTARATRQWHPYFRFKDKFMLMEDLKDAQGKLLVKKDFDYAYALTVHKSQGSTYTNVFVDEDDIDKNSNDTDRNKLKYVAFSRPTAQAHVLSAKTIDHEGSHIPREELVG